MDPTSASAFLAQADIEPADLALWADFAHSARDSYGRKLVGRGPNFELMVMSWGPGDYSAIHDHGAADWGAVHYLGAADHATFHMKDGLPTIRERRTMELNDICAVDASLIHLMGNPRDTPFLSMHLYGRAYAAESITGGARVFDLWAQRIQRTDGGVFFCLAEENILRREPCPDSDCQTKILHHRLMSARVKRILSVEKNDLELRRRVSSLQREIGRLETGSWVR